MRRRNVIPAGSEYRLKNEQPPHVVDTVETDDDDEDNRTTVRNDDDSGKAADDTVNLAELSDDPKLGKARLYLSQRKKELEEKLRQRREKDEEVTVNNVEKTSSTPQPHPKYVFGSTDIRYRREDVTSTTAAATINALNKEAKKGDDDKLTANEVLKIVTPDSAAEEDQDKCSQQLDHSDSDSDMFSVDEDIIPGVLPPTVTLEQSDDHLVLKIPYPITCTRLPVRSAAADILSHRIRTYLWSNKATPPDLVTPQRVHLFTRESDMFYDAIEDMNENYIRIGVSVVVEDLVDTGIIKFISCATTEDVYIFDVQKFGEANLFECGLRFVLEDKEIVSHVFPTQILARDFGVERCNVFDVAGANAAVANWLLKEGNVVKIVPVNRLHVIVRDYLGVASLHLPSDDPTRGESVEDFMMNLARNTMYMLELYDILIKGLMLPMFVSTEAVMRNMIEMSEEDYEQFEIVPQEVTDAAKKCFPVWKH